jgi:hypothetical protein
VNGRRFEEESSLGGNVAVFAEPFDFTLFGLFVEAALSAVSTGGNGDASDSDGSVRVAGALNTVGDTSSFEVFSSESLSVEGTDDGNTNAKIRRNGNRLFTKRSLNDSTRNCSFCFDDVGVGEVDDDGKDENDDGDVVGE